MTTAMSTTNAETSAFPTFLDTDPYPSRTPDVRPVSSGTAATDTTSEFGDDFTSAKERQSHIPSITGPVGEPGLPPSRPTSVGTNGAQARASPRTSLAPPASRRGLASVLGGGRNSLRSTEGDASRPNSPMSQTHVPSLKASGFFRPLSSQKLQAQRGPRPVSPLGQHQTRRSEDSSATAEGRRHRYSNASVNTLRDGPPPTQDEDVPPLPVSRGTAFTSEGETLRDHHAAGSVASHGSAAPLQRKQSPGSNLKLESNGTASAHLQPGQKSPKSPKSSLRASLGLSSRRASKQEKRMSPNGHAQLQSDPSSPVNGSEKPPLSSHGRQPTAQKMGRNYEYYSGNSLFFGSGRWLNTKAKPLNVLTFTLTCLPAGIFFGFSAPWLWNNVSPALPIIFAYVFYVCISSFLHAAFSDPGILPRNVHPHPPNPDEDRDPLTVGPPTTEWVMVRTFSSNKAIAQAPSSDPEIGSPTGSTATAMEVPTKYCKTCGIWRPPRAHHCRVCDACIETQDHHCVWLNNCVGRRNYRYFFAYVASATLLSWMLFFFSFAHMYTFCKQRGNSFKHSLQGPESAAGVRAALAMAIYSLVVGLAYPGSLFAYHLFLIARGETTREYLNAHKFLKKDRHRPHSHNSWLKNWIAVLNRPRPPTYMQFKKSHGEGDLRYGHTAPKRQRKADLKARYSVANGAEGEKKGVEMQQLPPSATVAKPQARGATTGGVAGGLSGPVNSTPR